jgi:hypothetical protein
MRYGDALSVPLALNVPQYAVEVYVEIGEPGQ